MNNPSSYVEEKFVLTYSSTENVIEWYFSGKLLYFLVQAPEFIKLDTLQVANKNIKIADSYNFAIVNSTF